MYWQPSIHLRLFIYFMRICTTRANGMYSQSFLEYKNTLKIWIVYNPLMILKFNHGNWLNQKLITGSKEAMLKLPTTERMTTFEKSYFQMNVKKCACTCVCLSFFGQNKFHYIFLLRGRGVVYYVIFLIFLKYTY